MFKLLSFAYLVVAGVVAQTLKAGLKTSIDIAVL
jgi:hypothetical protein